MERSAEADELEVRLREVAEFGLALVGAGGLQREHQVVAGGHPGKKRVVLEDNGTCFLRSVDLTAVDRDAPGIRLQQTGEQTQERRFAATGLSEQAQEGPVGDVEVDPVEDGLALECDGNVVALDHCTASL